MKQAKPKKHKYARLVTIRSLDKLSDSEVRNLIIHGIEDRALYALKRLDSVRVRPVDTD